MVKYNLYNVGDNAATNVQVNSSLTLESGSFKHIFCHRWQTMGSARRTSTWSPDRRSTSWTGLPQAPTPPTPWWSGPRSLVTSTSLLLRWGITTILILDSAHNNRNCCQVTYSASESVGTVVSFFFEINIHFPLSRMSLRTFTPNEESSFFCHQLKYSSHPSRLSCTSLTTGWSLL